MPNKRIFYASHAVGIKDVVEGGGVDYFDTIRGAQSVAINTNFNLEQVFQLGRIGIYDNFSTDPEVEVTINKVLDGYGLIFNVATSDDSAGIVERANSYCTVLLHVDDETKDFIDGVPTVAVKMSGCYVNSLTYNFPVDGNFTEEVSFIGSNKEITTDALLAPEANPNKRVLRRQNMLLSGQTVLPVAVSGQCITNISISTNFNREKMFCLGQYSPFHRYVNFPIEVTISFDVNPNGNGPSLIGNNFTESQVPQCSGSIIEKEPIKISVCGEGASGILSPMYTFDLGSGCSLQSVSYSGGDTGGGNVTETYTYITYNDLRVIDHT